MSEKCDGCELDMAHEKCMAEVSALTAERDALKERVNALEEALKEIENYNGCRQYGDCSCGCLDAVKYIAESTLAKHEGEKP